MGPATTIEVPCNPCGVRLGLGQVKKAEKVEVEDRMFDGTNLVTGKTRVNAAAQSDPKMTLLWMIEKIRMIR